MTLQAGTKLGPYEIQSVAGAGGMGEVYRARDTRLERTVAIKVLPESFAGDPDRLRRFEQEARTVAALNHPNIMAVYDIGEHAGAPYMVSELLDGETLREKMKEGPLAQRRAVEYASQIAEGLAAAHDKGVVHRDLKPENVFVTNDGRVKVLDFGLAKLRALPTDRDGATMGTQTSPGMVLGTAGYMSPEQVRGKEVDARTDIFAFGAILYEMLSGQRAFKGESSVETMNAILKEEPPELETEKLKVSPGLERIVRRCLEKEPARRFHSARDVGFALEAISGSSATASMVKVKPGGRVGRRWIAGAVLLLVVGSLAGALAARRSLSPTLIATQQLTFRSGYVRAARFAPDGQAVVYGANWDGAPAQLYSGRVDTSESQPIESVKADLLSVSRSGELAVALDRRFLEPWVPTGTLARSSLLGGAPKSMLEGVTDADWAPDGSALAIARGVAGRFQLEYPVGKPLYTTDGFISHLRFSPQGDVIAFMDHPVYGDDAGTVAIVDLQGNKKTLTPSYDTEQGLAWTPDGKEIWYSEGITLHAVPRSGKVRTVWSALEIIVIQDISRDRRVMLTTEDRGGDIIAGTIGGAESRNLVTFHWAAAYGISNDGQLAAIDEFDAGSRYEMFVRRTDGSPAVHLGQGVMLGMSPDGKTVLGMWNQKLLLAPTGVGEIRELPSFGLAYQSMAGWLPDGQHVAVVAAEPGRPARTFALATSGKTPPRPITPEGMLGLLLSPDGASVLARDGEGRWMMCALSGGEPHPIAGMKSEDTPVQWSADGRLLIRSRGEVPLTVYQLDPRTGIRQPWHRFVPANPAGVLSFRRVYVTPDGKHYLYDTRRVLSRLFVVTGLK